MQDTYIDAYKSLGQFQGRSDFKTWLIRIMLNNCYRKSLKRSHSSEVAQIINEQSTPMFANQEHDTEKVIQGLELRHVIEQALLSIPLDYRIVFSLREIGGLNVAETAEVLNLTESNVKVRLNRAKTMLRTEIESTYTKHELFEFNLIYCDRIVENVMARLGSSGIR